MCCKVYSPFTVSTTVFKKVSNLSFICYIMCFVKFVKFSPNVYMLVVLVVNFGRRNIVACRNKFKVNNSVSDTTHSRAAAIRFGMVRCIECVIQLEGFGGILPQKIFWCLEVQNCFLDIICSFWAIRCFL